jgi:multiple sugar transport system ATP-binding protein
VVVGIRPEDIEDAELESDTPSDRRFRTTVDLREALGSEVLVHFTVAAPPVLTEDTKELARDLGVHEGGEGSRPAASSFVARLDPRTRAQERESIELVVDTERLHFFDPETGLGIDSGGGPDGVQPRTGGI